ncbi:unnamed protein product [Gongylonema pulchrum]|uniref:Uncharacterized protein n=1 Tax=Gongylonema pulchrum TaxID=637853 RepID=A0A183DAI7_9BILA|nr:unnamed protein product [Gongylonema pulchrum]
MCERQPAKGVDVGVNTILEMGVAEGSSSSNTTSDNSAGQLPKRLFDTVLLRPSLTIVSLRPDGSIVPGSMSASRRLPSVHEWSPKSEEEVAERSVISSNDNDVNPVVPNNTEDNEEERLESISAATSRPDRSEDDSNTLANISPIPHA